MENFGKFCLMLIILTLSVFIGGFIFIKLYEWFIIPVFHLPQPTFTQALGIMLFIGYLKGTSKKDTENDKSIEDYIEDCIKSMVLAVFVLGLGYLIYQFV